MERRTWHLGGLCLSAGAALTALPRPGDARASLDELVRELPIVLTRVEGRGAEEVRAPVPLAIAVTDQPQVWPRGRDRWRRACARLPRVACGLWRVA